MTSSLPGVDSTGVQDTAMTHSTHEQRLSLITQMMCCLIAADAKVSSSEIDVVYDSLVGIGLPVTHDEFRTRVIEACKAIHKNGALQVASSLAAASQLVSEPISSSNCCPSSDPARLQP